MCKYKNEYGGASLCLSGAGVFVLQEKVENSEGEKIYQSRESKGKARGDSKGKSRGRKCD